MASFPILRILAVSLFVRTTVTLTALMNSTGRYTALANITASNLALNIALVLMLVPVMGVAGAIWAALGTELWNMVAQWLLLICGDRSARVGDIAGGLTCE